jgi:hypothetical protein
MRTQPPDPGKTPPTGLDRLRKPREAQPTRPAGPPQAPAPAPPPADRVELSDAARDLAERLGVDPAALSALPAERRQQILERLAQGYYDRPEVRDEVARRLLGDLEAPPREG